MMKAIILAAILLAVYLAVDSTPAGEEEEIRKEKQRLVKECPQYLTEKGRQFFSNVHENSVFEEEIVHAGRILHNCLVSDDTNPCHNDRVGKAMAIAAELHDKKDYKIQANPDATKKLVMEPYEAYVENTPERCAKLITGFVLKNMHEG